MTVFRSLSQACLCFNGVQHRESAIRFLIHFSLGVSVACEPSSNPPSHNAWCLVNALSNHVAQCLHFHSRTIACSSSAAHACVPIRDCQCHSTVQGVMACGTES